jgi:hypothetical protein
MSEKHEVAVRRAALPEVMFAPDMALVLGIPDADADKAARQGRLGPQFFVAGRVAVLRQDFLEFLTLRAASQIPGAKEVLT